MDNPEFFLHEVFGKPRNDMTSYEPYFGVITKCCNFASKEVVNGFKALIVLDCVIDCMWIVY